MVEKGPTSNQLIDFVLVRRQRDGAVTGMDEENRVPADEWMEFDDVATPP